MIRGTWNLTDPLVPVNIPATMVRLGTEQGINTDVLLKNTGISPELLANPSARLSYQQIIFHFYISKPRPPNSFEYTVRM